MYRHYETKRSLPFLTLSLYVAALVGCSSNGPRVGDSISISTSPTGDVTLTETESRRLLPSGKIAGSSSTELSVESQVENVDFDRRALTLRSSSGELIDVVAGPEVRNFNQIKKGDRVRLQYFNLVAFEVREPSKEEIAAAGSILGVAGRAKLGQLPAGGVAAARKGVAKVRSVDRYAQTVTLQELDSDAVIAVKAKYPENLAYVRAGDSVVVTAMEAIAASIVRLQ